MFDSIRKKISTIEMRLKGKISFFPDDSDGFITALGVNPQKYELKNPDGSTGYDAIRVLSDLAAEDWKE